MFSHLCKTRRFCRRRCGWIHCSEVRDDEEEREREKEIVAAETARKTDGKDGMRLRGEGEGERRVVGRG